MLHHREHLIYDIPLCLLIALWHAGKDSYQYATGYGNCLQRHISHNHININNTNNTNDTRKSPAVLRLSVWRRAKLARRLRMAGAMTSGLFVASGIGVQSELDGHDCHCSSRTCLCLYLLLLLLLLLFMQPLPSCCMFGKANCLPLSHGTSHCAGPDGSYGSGQSLPGPCTPFAVDLAESGSCVEHH